MNRYLFALALAALACSPFTVHASWLVKQERIGGEVRILSVQRSERPAARTPQTLRSLPSHLREDAPVTSLYEEILYSDLGLPPHIENEPKNFLAPVTRFNDTEVRTLVSQGPKENRINLTILGDGYTLAEKERFFADAERIKNDLFVGQTFASYLPLFNVYAVFVPSKESGLTDGANRKDTAFGLYREPPGSKRAILPGNEDALEAALRLAPATDYPIVLANDDFYGGLGGRFAISTRSVESGSIVLRHELGHNFGEVGEEYDGGYVYSGANSSRTRNVTWAHWLPQGKLQVVESLFLSGQYVWQNLGQKEHSAQVEFPKPSAEGPYQFEVIVSSVGWKSPGDVTVEFDGQKVELEGRWTADRSFYTFHLAQSPAPGRHRLTVRENIHDGDNVLAFVMVYAQPATLDIGKSSVGAFATFNSDERHAGYRPTHKACLMRDMLNLNFCDVDKENMWAKFLSRVELIDGVAYESKTKTVMLQAPPLPGMSIQWFQVARDGRETELTDVAGKRIWTNTTGLSGMLKAKVAFSSPEVRKPFPGLTSEKTLLLP